MFNLRRIHVVTLSAPPLIMSLSIALALLVPCSADQATNKTKDGSSKIASTEKSNSAANAKSASGKTSSAKIADAKGKPKILPWKEFQNKNERTYNVFKYNLTRMSVPTGNPDNWRTFDPSIFAEKKKLVPEPGVSETLGPIKYSDRDFAAALDPSAVGAVDGFGTKVVFAHQGTPLVNGWLAPKAGYAYQKEGILVYGTTNYTPVNYNGNMSKFIGVSRVPVDILAPNGRKQQPLDLSRLVFPVNDDLLSRPQSKVYPSLIYLKQGEVASIQGHGNVNCPRPGMTEQITLQTPNGEQSIKILCSPDNAVIPGKITP